MTEDVAGKMVMGSAVVTSLGMSCRSGAALSAGIPAFTPHTLAAKLGVAGLGCLGGMLTSVASAALFAKETAPSDIQFDAIDTSEIDANILHTLPVNNSTNISGITYE